MKALVTGITGFAGSYLADHLQAAGDQVLGCVRDDAARAKQASRAGAEAVCWDLARQEQPSADGARRIEQFAPDCIFHLAAQSVPALCGDDQPTPEALAINVEGTRRVVELAAALPCAPRVLLTSSSHVYAPAALPGQPLAESAPLDPQNAYGATKLAAERSAERANQAGQVELIIARAFQHCGPRQNPRMMLAEWASQLAAGKSPLEVVSRHTWIDATDVRDVVRAYRLLAVDPRAVGIFNVGSGKARTTSAWLEALLDAAGRRPPIVERSTEERFDRVADITRLESLTGWKCEIPLQQTAADTYRDWEDRLVRH